MNGDRRRSELVGLGLAAMSALAFGTVAISAKYAYREGADAVPLLASRFGIAFVLLGLYHVSTTGRRRSSAPRSRLALFALGAFGYGLESTLFFVALEHAPAGTVSLIFYSFPLWTTILGLALGLERFRWPVLAALGLGTVGVSLIFSVSTDDLRGPLYALVAAVAVAVYFVTAQVVARGVPASVSALWTAGGAASVLTITGIATGQALPAHALPYSLALGIATAIAFVALYGALARLGSARASIAEMLEPVTTVALAALLLDEAITGRIAVGAALVVAALPVLAASGHRDEVPPPPDSL